MRVVRSHRSVWSVLLTALLLPFPSFAADLFVNNRDSLCREKTPCFSSIQEAIDRALPGDQVQIQPGVYREQLEIRGKNSFSGASHADRIVIRSADLAPLDSVVLDGEDFRRVCSVGAIRISESGYVTITGLVITGFDGPAIQLLGGPDENTAVHIERNRIFDNGSERCNGGIVIEKGNPDTLVINNLIYANGGDGIELSTAESGGSGWLWRTRRREEEVGGPHYLIQNTIHDNGMSGVSISPSQSATLANNAVTGNGSSQWAHRARDRSGGYGVIRDDSRNQGESEISMLNNLLCGNRFAEVDGPVFVGSHADNLTPTGTEALGVLASPECEVPHGVYENLEGADGLPGTLDDDFALTGPGGHELPSPAIDRGLDSRTLGLGTAVTPLLLADFLAPAVRPIERDSNRPLEFDIGALELSCACDENCESCTIVIGDDGSSADLCVLSYEPDTQCCNRLSGAVGNKEIPHAFDVCRDTRTQIPGFDSEGNADGCSLVSDRPLVNCPEVRFGCDEDGNEANCPEGIDLPCNRHDFCYQTCGQTQEDCDDAFYDDMVRVCNNMTPLQKTLCYTNCLADALTYYKGVDVGGYSSYVNGQNRSCQCCQDVP